MLSSLKRWWSQSRGHSSTGLEAIEAWAGQSGLRYRRDDDGSRFVIEAPSAGQMLRMEWGPSQRSYIAGDELRIRLDLNLPGALQLLAMTRPLMERLEQETFERYTQEAQTIIDMSHPEEMRWLAMFPKIDLSFDKVLQAHYGVLGVNTVLGMAWINGPLGEQLAMSTHNLLAGDEPFVLMAMRGKLYLRMQLAQPQPKSLSQCLSVFDAAVQSALQLTGQLPPGGGEWSPTASSSWLTPSAMDEPAHDPR
jgi:hypothetical protein